LKCLRKKPEQRYTSAQALAEDLRLFLCGEPIHARPLNIAEKIIAWAHRMPILAAHLVTCILLYLMHLIALFILQEPSHGGLNQFYTGMSFFGWLIAMFTVQYIYQYRQQRLGEYLFVILPMSLIHLENILVIGPSYHIPVFLPLAILAAVLIRPQSGMVWFATSAAHISFNIFAITSNVLDRLPYSIERIFLFNLVILLTGIVTFLLLRRIRASQIY
jgi:hypothetical protein